MRTTFEAAAVGAPGAAAPLTPAELLGLGKAVAQAVELTRRRLLQPPPPPPAPAGAAAADSPRSDEELRQEFEDILFRGK